MFVIIYIVFYVSSVFVINISYFLDLIKFKSFNIMFLFSHNSFSSSCFTIFYSTLIIYLFTLSIYLLYDNIKKRESRKIIIFSIFSLIFGVLNCLVFYPLFEDKGSDFYIIPTASPDNFRTNQLTGKCELGNGANSGGGLNLKWYHKKGCESYEEIVIEDLLKDMYFPKLHKDKIAFRRISSKPNLQDNFFIVNGDFSKIYEIELSFEENKVDISMDGKTKKLTNQQCGEVIIDDYEKYSEKLLVELSLYKKADLFNFENINLDKWNCKFNIGFSLKKYRFV